MMISHHRLFRTIFRLLFNFQGSSADDLKHSFALLVDSLYIISHSHRFVKHFFKSFLFFLKNSKTAKKREDMAGKISSILHIFLRARIIRIGRVLHSGTATVFFVPRY